MAEEPKLTNAVRAFRTRCGWSQDELARRCGLSRAGISAIETDRLVPSTAAALALAAAFGCAVESLFRLSRPPVEENASAWAWTEPRGSCRYWRARIGDRLLRYPVEVSPLGLLPHDGTYRDGVFEDSRWFDPERTLVLACCDPAVGLLAAELMRSAEYRLIVVQRSSGAALKLLAQGLVHAAGVHLARSDEGVGNAQLISPHLANAASNEYQLLRIAEWEEGIALQPTLGLRTIRAVVGSRLRWIGRELGSGARRCLDEVLGKASRRDPTHEMPCARDHRGVADAIRASWADAGICLRLTSEEANLSFLSVRQEAYEICFPEALADDPRLQALLAIARSSSFRRSLGALPGYDTRRMGALAKVRVGAS
jgi:molybdate-binding protein/DNA-binding XRE family transcriptional regulator